MDEQLDLPTYLQQEHILVSSRRQGPGPVDVELSRLGLQRHVRLRCTQYLAACRIVSNSDLILTMPEFDALAVNQAFDNRILPLPLDTATLDIYLYWHATVDNDPANRWLRAQLMEVFDELRGG